MVKGEAEIHLHTTKLESRQAQFRKYAFGTDSQATTLKSAYIMYNNILCSLKKHEHEIRVVSSKSSDHQLAYLKAL